MMKEEKRVYLIDRALDRTGDACRNLDSALTDLVDCNDEERLLVYQHVLFDLCADINILRNKLFDMYETYVNEAR